MKYFVSTFAFLAMAGLCLAQPMPLVPAAPAPPCCVTVVDVMPSLSYTNFAFDSMTVQWGPSPSAATNPAIIYNVYVFGTNQAGSPVQFVNATHSQMPWLLSLTVGTNTTCSLNTSVLPCFVDITAIDTSTGEESQPNNGQVFVPPPPITNVLISWPSNYTNVLISFRTNLTAGDWDAAGWFSNPPAIISTTNYPEEFFDVTDGSTNKVPRNIQPQL